MEIIKRFVRWLEGLDLGYRDGIESVELSTGRYKDVCGYRVHKMHLGAWLKATKRLAGLSKELLAAIFPGKSLDVVLNELSGIDTDGFFVLVSTAIDRCSELVIELVAEISGIPQAELLDNPDIGLNGLMKIIKACIEVNELGEFAANLKGTWLTGMK